MKVGILTYHSSDNYGAYLQSYALAKALHDATNYEVEIIDFTMSKAAAMNKKMINFNRRQLESWLFNYYKYKMFIESRKKWLPLSEEALVSDDLNEFSQFVERQKYDAVIVGSDEVWKLDGFRGFPNPYWLPNVHDVKKVAYAVSARNAVEDLAQEVVVDASKLMSEFVYVGVRDSATQKLAFDLAGHESKKIHVNCDPTFAYNYNPNKENGKRILREKFRIDTNKACVGLMCGVPTLANEIVKKYKNKVQIVSLYYYYRHTKGFYVLTPFEWIDVIAALDGLITTFFHGMVFAIKSDTRFLAIENRPVKNISSSKSYDLLKRNGLESNCVNIAEKEEVSRSLEKFIEEICSKNFSCDFSKARTHERKMFTAFVDEFKGLLE